MKTASAMCVAVCLCAVAVVVARQDRGDIVKALSSYVSPLPCVDGSPCACPRVRVSVKGESLSVWRSWYRVCARSSMAVNDMTTFGRRGSRHVFPCPTMSFCVNGVGSTSWTRVLTAANYPRSTFRGTWSFYRVFLTGR